MKKTLLMLVAAGLLASCSNSPKISLRSVSDGELFTVDKTNESLGLIAGDTVVVRHTIGCSLTSDSRVLYGVYMGKDQLPETFTSEYTMSDSSTCHISTFYYPCVVTFIQE